MYTRLAMSEYRRFYRPNARENKYRRLVRRHRDIAQNRVDPLTDLGHVAVHARLVAGDRVAIDHEKLLFRIRAAENIDQHAAEFARCHVGHLANSEAC